jgi:hypothetical protein
LTSEINGITCRQQNPAPNLGRPFPKTLQIGTWPNFELSAIAAGRIILRYQGVGLSMLTIRNFAFIKKKRL